MVRPEQTKFANWLSKIMESSWHRPKRSLHGSSEGPLSDISRPGHQYGLLVNMFDYDNILGYNEVSNNGV